MPDPEFIVTLETLPPDDAAFASHVAAVLDGVPPTRALDDALLAQLRDGYPEAGAVRAWTRPSLYPGRVVWTVWRDVELAPATREAGSLFASPTVKRISPG